MTEKGERGNILPRPDLSDDTTHPPKASGKKRLWPQDEACSDPRLKQRSPAAVIKSRGAGKNHKFTSGPEKSSPLNIR